MWKRNLLPATAGGRIGLLLQVGALFAAYHLSTFRAGPERTDVLDVKAFGAVGDGKADDTDAIEASPVEGGVVYFPTG